MGVSYIKHPDAVLDYGFDWSDWLESAETIASSEWDVPSGLSEESLSGYTDTTTLIWLAGGIKDEDYDVINHITTSEGREDSRTMTIKVRSR